MLKLTGIKKTYVVGEMKIKALRGVDLEFRKNEFVAVLGPSGCGKTTLLNIVGGLDRYTAGDLVIQGRSTKEYKDSDLDAYRNHSVGFVFQTYNLIPHQNVLSNVELALTISGVSKKERRRRAMDVLERVGLSDQLSKKPNQLSGGQMQRVAIARALVNDPEILLADEPTGALDSETSLQIMDILREIASDRLVIMVTHNPELANEYATRIVRFLDGKVISDTNPFDSEASDKPNAKSARKPSMSFATALSLSLNNLLTKKGRTFMTAFAGSIGIIGIALILSLSNGMQAYIDRVQEDTLSTYPLEIEEQSVDISSMMGSMMSARQAATEHPLDKVYSANIMSRMISSVSNEMTRNNIVDFKTYLDDPENGFDELTSDIKYSYSTRMNIYKSDTSEGIVQVRPEQVFNSLGLSGGASANGGMMSTSLMNTDIWTEQIGSNELLSVQYDVLAGRLPESYDEIVLMVDKNNEVSDYALYALGIMDIGELDGIARAIMRGEEHKELSTEQTSYSYDEVLNLGFTMLLNTDYYEKVSEGVWKDRSNDEEFIQRAIENGIKLHVVGIIRAANNSSLSTSSGQMIYTEELKQYLVERVGASEIVQYQLANPEIDVFTGLAFDTGDASPQINMQELTAEQQAYLASLSETERANLMEQMAASMTTDATYEGNLRALGYSDPDSPSAILIYPKDFESKEIIEQKIQDYNKAMEDAGLEENVIRYTDFVGLMMSSVSTIIDAISYVLIAFVAISLVVSSIMIGIITYISVLERTKEIGILRSIGARKRDISRVFNAETLIVGFIAGVIGLVVTFALTIPANAIIERVTEIQNLAVLPPESVILVGISMGLTYIAGLIPSKVAANRDPVVALRSE